MSKIFESIPKIMAAMDAIGKDRKNLQQNFMFRGIDDLYNALQKLLAKHEVFTTPVKILSLIRKDIISKQGTAGVHIANEYTFRFYASDASYFDVITIGEGVDYGDKASNKAAAIAHKYALLQTFCIPTEDDKDPDGHGHEIKPESNATKSNINAPKPQNSSKPTNNQSGQPMAYLVINFNDQQTRDNAKAAGFTWQPALKSWGLPMNDASFNEMKKLYPTLTRG